MVAFQDHEVDTINAILQQRRLSYRKESSLAHGNSETRTHGGLIPQPRPRAATLLYTPWFYTDIQHIHHSSRAHPAPVQCTHFKDDSEELLGPTLTWGPPGSLFPEGSGEKAGKGEQRAGPDVPLLHPVPSLFLQPARPTL